MTHMEFVEAQLAFVNEEWRHAGEPPRIYSRESRHRNTTRHDVLVHNARLVAEEGKLDLDTNGFILLTKPTAFTRYDEKEAVQGEYFPEVHELVKGLTGADATFAFPFYQVRSREPEHFFDAYSLYMHCDFSPDSWGTFSQDIVKMNGRSGEFPAEEYDFAFYNTWRPVRHRVEQDPLVIIDAATVRREDIIDYLVEKEGDKALAAVPLYHPQQKFYYVPLMEPDEILVLKQLDSRPGRALVCPHTSFVDTTAPADARPRESIDVRVMCAFRKT
ncbi:MAG: CmcJ/NvfI family oxidoreductase [Pseudomonadota bacterium]